MQGEQQNHISKDSRLLLLVEDEAVIALDRKQCLEQNNYQVITANNGEEAVSIAREQDIRLVLMDIDLGKGKMDGTKTAQMILREKELPIIFLTGHAEKKMVDKVKGITRYGYVLKSSGDFVLLESINMAFELFDEKKKSRINQQKLQTALYEKNLILESTQEMFVYYDTNLKILWANKASAESMGMEVQELIGLHCYEIWHRRNQPCDNCPVVLAKKTGKPAEAQNTTPDGRIWFLRGYPIKDDTGKVTGLTEFGTDITNTVQVQRNLAESESRFRQIAEHIQEVVYIFDPGENKFLYVSPVYEKVWEKPVDEVYSDPNAFAKSVHPEDTYDFYQAQKKETLGIEFFNLKFRIICPGDRTKLIWSRNYPVTDQTGKHYRTVGISQDITGEYPGPTPD